MHPVSSRPGVRAVERADFFISYTGADAKRAEWIAEVLEDRGGYSTVFQAWDFRPGDDFVANMHVALERCDKVLAVCSRRYLDSSRFGRMEWRSALASGEGRVVPVRIEDVRMPGLLAPIAYIDLVGQDDEEDATNTLLEGVREPGRRTPAAFPGFDPTTPAFMAPDPPPRQVARPKPIARLHELSSSGKNRVSLLGPGGFGKSALASLFCHDPATRERFPDGILWVTLGPAGVDLVASLGKLHKGLTGASARFADVEDAAVQVASALAKRRCLLVLDDVWDPAHLAPFLRGGEECFRLVTTRLLPVAEGADMIKVDRLSGAESLELLAAGMPEPIGDLRPLEKLLPRLGDWALLIELVAAALRRERLRGASMEEAAAYVGKILDHEGVGAFDPADAEARREAIAGTLTVGLKRLDEDSRQLYTNLSIFPAEVAVPLSTVAALWEVGEYSARRLATTLDDMSLVRLDLRSRELHLHGAVRRYLQHRIEDPVATHQRLAEAWGDPLSLDDDYALRYMAYHLSRSDQAPVLRELVLDPRWLRAKIERLGTHSLVTDCDTLGEDPVVVLVRQALELSSHVLAADPGQIESQLSARLSWRDEPEILTFRRRLNASAPRPWLRPKWTNLVPPGGPLLRTFRHEDFVKALGVTQDGKCVFSASNRDLRLWDLESGELLHTFDKSGAAEQIAALTERTLTVANHSVVLISTIFAYMKVWSLEDYSEIRATGGVTALAATPDLSCILSATDENAIELRHPLEDVEPRILQGHTGTINRLAISGNGELAVSSSNDNTIRVWDLENCKEVAEIERGDDVCRAIAITPDGRHVIGSVGNTIKVWDTTSGDPRRTLDGHHAFVTSLSVSRDGERLVSAGADRRVLVWDLATGDKVATLTDHSQPVHAADFLPDGHRVVTGANDGTWRLWDIERETDPRPAGHGRYISALAYTQDGQTLITASGNGDVKLWDTRSRIELRTFRAHDKVLTGMAVSQDGRHLVTGSWDKRLRVWDLDTLARVHDLAGHDENVQGLSLTTEGEIISISGDFIGQSVTFMHWQIATGEKTRGYVQRINYRPGTDPGIAASSDGRRAISNGGDGVLRVLDPTTGKVIAELEGHADEISALAISADGRRAMTGSRDNSVRVWDLEAGRTEYALEGHTAPVRAVALSSDARMAVSAGQDRSLRLWDLTEGRERARYSGEYNITACAFAPDDGRICGGDTSGRPFELEIEVD